MGQTMSDMMRLTPEQYQSQKQSLELQEQHAEERVIVREKILLMDLSPEERADFLMWLAI